MYYAMYGEFSNGESEYVVTGCGTESGGENECMSKLIDYANKHFCEITYYTPVNGMPEELRDDYDPYEEYTFVDGVLMKELEWDEDEYEIVEYLYKYHC